MLPGLGRLTLARKLMLPPAVGLVALAAVAAMAYYGIRQHREAIGDISQVRFQRLQLALEASAVTQKGNSDFLGLLVEPLQGQSTAVRKVTEGVVLARLRAAHPTLEFLEKLPQLDPAEARAIAAAKALLNDYAAQAEAMLAARQANPYAVRDAGSNFKRVSRAFADLVNVERTLTLQAFEDADRRSTRILAAFSAVLALALAASLAVTVILTGHVRARIGTIRNAAAALSGGDLTRRAEIAGSDEISDTARAFNFLVDELGKAMAQLKVANEQLRGEMLASLSASQAMSSETDLARLTARVIDPLASMTGARGATLFSLDAERGEADAPPASVLGVARDAELPVIVADAMQDARFAGDPWLQGREACALLVVPVAFQGRLRAVLVLEDRPRDGVFSSANLDVVMLIANQLAISLENAQVYRHLDRLVQQRTAQLRAAQKELLKAAHSAGMATVAANVLHNVGNILNSVNVSANLLRKRVDRSRAGGVGRLADLVSEHRDHLADFLVHDPRGRLVPAYLRELATALAEERRLLLADVGTLARDVEHIMEVVSMQQSLAGPGAAFLELCVVGDLVEDAVRTQADLLAAHGVRLVRQVDDMPALPVDRHRMVLVLVNLVRNACQALAEAAAVAPEVRVSAGMADGERLRIVVADNGIGIDPENLPRVFSQGFTTRGEGHGYGLHGSALAAMEMGGTLTVASEGIGKGASFTLQVPVAPPQQVSSTTEKPMEEASKNFMRPDVARAVLLAVCAGAALVAPQDSVAQPTPLDRVEITGSAIRRVDAETALPVTVIQVDALKQQGFTTVEEIVNSLSVNQSNAGTTRAMGTVTGGGAFANLRGLGASRTLVLLNGRRMGNQAVRGAGDAARVDLNTIPLAVLDRVEVLRDGASSLYGSDAIGGVINFITKRSYAGAEASAQFTQPQHPGGKSWEANLGFGRGDLARDRWNVFGFVDVQHQDAVTSPQRAGFATSTQTSTTGFPATWSQGSATVNPLAPACNGQFQAKSSIATSCDYLFWNWVDLIPKADRVNGMLKGTLALPGGHELSLEYAAARTDVWTNTAPVPESSLTMFPTIRVNGVATTQANPYYPSGVPNPRNSIRVRWRAIPAGPRAGHNESMQQRFVAALEGSVAGWDYSTAFSTNSVRTSNTLVGGYVDDAKIAEAVASGKLNPFTANLPPEQLALVANAGITGKLYDAKGRSDAWDGRASRELGDWFGAGRRAALALGAEWRSEDYTQKANTPVATAVASASGFDPDVDHRGARRVWGLYGELNVPVTRALEVTASVRHDRYPEFGSTTNPKLSARFQPGDTWLARGSVASGFRAPSLYQLYSVQTFTNTSSAWNDPVRCPGGKPIAGVSTSDNCSVQFVALIGGNPALTPEKSKTATFGLVLQPAQPFDASVDFWWVRLTNSIGAITDSTVFNDPATYASHFVRAADGSLANGGGLCNTVANPGPQCGYVSLLNDNLGGVRSNGVDLAANLRMRTGMGHWTFRVQETYVNRYRFQTQRNGPWFDAVGAYANIPGVSGGGPVFRNQWSVSAQWAMGAWTAGVVNRYKSGYRDADVGQVPVGRVGSWSTWDVYGAWSPTAKFTLTLGIRNVLDTAPPSTQQTTTSQVGYDPRFADAMLRAFYVRGLYKF